MFRSFSFVRASAVVASLVGLQACNEAKETIVVQRDTITETVIDTVIDTLVSSDTVQSWDTILRFDTLFDTVAEETDTLIDTVVEIALPLTSSANLLPAEFDTFPQEWTYVPVGTNGSVRGADSLKIFRWSESMMSAEMYLGDRRTPANTYLEFLTTAHTLFSEGTDSRGIDFASNFKINGDDLTETYLFESVGEWEGPYVWTLQKSSKINAKLGSGIQWKYVPTNDTACPAVDIRDSLVISMENGMYSSEMWLLGASAVNNSCDTLSFHGDTLTGKCFAPLTSLKDFTSWLVLENGTDLRWTYQFVGKNYEEGPVCWRKSETRY